MYMTSPRRDKHHSGGRWRDEPATHHQRGHEPELFVSLAGHKMTVVAADAVYTKPFETTVVLLGPGQTTDVLVTAHAAPGRYYLGARVYAFAQGVPFDNTTATAIFQYKDAAGCPPTGAVAVAGAGAKTGNPGRAGPAPMFPMLPANNDTNTATGFSNLIRSLRPVKVPGPVTQEVFTTIGFGLFNCRPGLFCQGPNNTRFGASMNNVSFQLPTPSPCCRRTTTASPASSLRTSCSPAGGLRLHLAERPPARSGSLSRGRGCTASSTAPWCRLCSRTRASSRRRSTPCTSTATTSTCSPQASATTTPGGRGRSTWSTRPAGTPSACLSAAGPSRFLADNPGVWLVHCHIDAHLTGGLAMALVVEDGKTELQTTMPPPVDLPICGL
ncbi:hypothetical protein ZWY2020_006709 [Hordeum vulgare]|nr:hypothetical protein ZWY2020_006709 [Hordeum vulgare]